MSIRIGCRAKEKKMARYENVGNEKLEMISKSERTLCNTFLENPW